MNSISEFESARDEFASEVCDEDDEVTLGTATDDLLRYDQQMFSPAIAEVLNHVQPYDHWGINE